MSPNRGNKCFFKMNRRCFCVECLYIGNTVCHHSLASVRNVTRDRIGACGRLPPPSSERACLTASFRETSPSVSYRSTRLFVPSGAISISRQRIAHPFSRFQKTSTAVLSFLREPSRCLSSRWLFKPQLGVQDSNRSRHHCHTDLRCRARYSLHRSRLKAHVFSQLHEWQPVLAPSPRALVHPALRHLEQGRDVLHRQQLTHVFDRNCMLRTRFITT